jgi:acyl carrier protein
MRMDPDRTSSGASSDGPRSIYERLDRIMTERLHTDPPDATVDLFADGIVDSLGLVELILALEEEFGIRVDPAGLDIDRFRTLGRISTFIGERLPGSDGHARDG